MNSHEQIPLLAKLEISYVCDKCRNRITLGTFYEAMDEIATASTFGNKAYSRSAFYGELICPMCRENKGAYPDYDSDKPIPPMEPMEPYDPTPTAPKDKPLKDKE